MQPHQTTEQIDTIVIGGGQAGLATGYHLAKRGVRFLILDAHERVGDTWRKRWDSLHLFSTAKFDGLPGMPFPAARNAFPSKDEMADYVERYAARFQLPVRTGVRVERLWRNGDRFIIDAGTQRFEANRVVVAMSNYQEPVIPSFAKELGDDILQFHSKAYRGPAQLRDGGVLVVGAGNSGAEIAFDLARAGRAVTLAGRDVGRVAWRIDGFASKFLMQRVLFRFVFHRVLTANTPIGRRMQAKGHTAIPLIRVMKPDLLRAGIACVGRVTGARDGKPVVDDKTLDIRNVIWCTGWEPGFSWVDLPVFTERGDPRQHRGVSSDVPGLYFVGLHFMFAMSSAMVHGVGRDAEYVAAQIAGPSMAPRIAALGSTAPAPVNA